MIPKTDFERREDPSSRKGKKACISMCNLARSESMGYINLIPIPYCNASRYSEYMSDESGFFCYSQTISRVIFFLTQLYRICAHMVFIALASVIGINSSKVT